jgi:phospholipid/cholesterol/gamma-HCH transport system substrate-binding protein
LANALIYADEGKQLAKDLGELSAAMGQLAKDIKNEESLAHSLLYDPEKAKLVDDLAATAAALKVTSESISQGEGTIGMLARDPALYEDLRALVGGAQRNKLLRSYIRRTVQEGEAANASPWAPAPE